LIQFILQDGKRPSVFRPALDLTPSPHRDGASEDTFSLLLTKFFKSMFGPPLSAQIEEPRLHLLERDGMTGKT
jgi:hypothetical protein